MTFSFYFDDTATTEIYTLSLHAALPIYRRSGRHVRRGARARGGASRDAALAGGRAGVQRLRGAHARRGQRVAVAGRSEEPTSELQSRQYLVCRLLLEQKTRLLTPWSVFF